tara:strand:+ start:1083 stop:1310 length:228 start_codon:yes stop_codon:yes gene_type:complete
MQPNLSIGDLKRLKVPLCDINEQMEITLKINSFSETLDRLIISFGKKSTALEELKKSILKKAFSGELIKGCRMRI